MTVKLTVLGCSGGYPGPGAAASGYLFQTESTNIWIDAGAGTLSNLQRYISVSQLDAVVVSHEHPDHWGDLEGLCVATQQVKVENGIDVFAPLGLREHLYFRNFLDNNLNWQECQSGEKITIKEFQITFARTDHGPLTLAMHIEVEGKSIAYTADTGPGFTVGEFGEGFDLVLSEATDTSDTPEEMHKHLSGSQAGAMARDVGAKRLIITHQRPIADRTAVLAEAKSEFSNTEIAEENRTYEI